LRWTIARSERVELIGKRLGVFRPRGDRVAELELGFGDPADLLEKQAQPVVADGEDLSGLESFGPGGLAQVVDRSAVEGLGLVVPLRVLEHSGQVGADGSQDVPGLPVIRARLRPGAAIIDRLAVHRLGLDQAALLPDGRGKLPADLAQGHLGLQPVPG
jgi:hypothetical protein